MTKAAQFDRGELCRHQHRAMATVFEVIIAGEDPAFAEQAAFAAFQEIDRLELELSRYVPNSDISRINNLQPRGSVRVGPDAMECLRLAAECSAETDGAFDVTSGMLIDCWIGRDKSLLHPSAGASENARVRTGMHLLELDRSASEVRVADAVPCVDLGAIGKGYTVDKAVELLREWGIASALVHGGTSSVSAFGASAGENGWPVTLSHPGDDAVVLERIVLRDQSLGGSGIRKGMHIIDPRVGRPVQSRRAAWVCAESAARSDAVSTACMIMTHDEIAQYCARHSGNWAIVVEAGAGDRAGEVLRFGSLKNA